MTKRLFFAAMTCCMVMCSVAFVACSNDDKPTTYTYSMGFVGDVASGTESNGLLSETEVVDIFRQSLGVTSNTFTKSSDDEVVEGCEAAYKQMENLNPNFTGLFAVTNVNSSDTVCQVTFDSGANNPTKGIFLCGDKRTNKR